MTLPGPSHCRQEFRDAIADDLNVPQGLAAVWSMVREGNQRQDRAAWDAILDFDRVLGLGLERLLWRDVGSPGAQVGGTGRSPRAGT